MLGHKLCFTHNDLIRERSLTLRPNLSIYLLLVHYNKESTILVFQTVRLYDLVSFHNTVETKRIARVSTRRLFFPRSPLRIQNTMVSEFQPCRQSTLRRHDPLRPAPPWSERDERLVGGGYTTIKSCRWWEPLVAAPAAAFPPRDCVVDSTGTCPRESFVEGRSRSSCPCFILWWLHCVNEENALL